MNLYELFKRCLTIDYVRTRESGDYAMEKRGTVLYIFLEHSDGREDWKNNVRFSTEPYECEGEETLYVHRGFLKVWRAIAPHLEETMMDPSISKIVTVGYSHGAALAAFCHDYARHCRPDLAGHIRGYGFASPRVFRGTPTQRTKARWEAFTVVRIPNDLVTHLPPAFAGYFHVGSMLELCENGKYSALDAHRQESILAELKAFSEMSGENG